MRSDDPKVIVPSYDKMMWPTLQALIQLGGSGTIQEIMDKVIEIARYTEVQQAILHGDGPQTEIAYRLAWARTYLRNVGALENSRRGVWTITEYGRSLKPADMPDIPIKVRAMMPRKGRPDLTELHEAPEPMAGESSEQPRLSSTIFEEWRDALLDVLLKMHPSNFERLCQRLLRE